MPAVHPASPVSIGSADQRFPLLCGIGRRLRRWAPTYAAHVVMARRLDAGVALARKTPTLRVESAGEEWFPAVESICEEQGVDESWCREQLERGSVAVISIETDGSVSGVGFVATGRFWVDEIGRSFQPGEDGCYLYATYVRPPCRGRGIQAALDARRFAWAAEQGMRWAYVVIDAANLPSLKAHGRSGFCEIARITKVLWRGRTWTRLRRRSVSAAGDWSVSGAERG